MPVNLIEALEQALAVAKEARAEWDNASADMRAGKLLIALADAQANAEAKFRVWWRPQLPGKPFYFEVPDIATGRAVERALGLYDLFQWQHYIKPDYCNSGGLEWRHHGCTADEWQSLDDGDAADTVALYIAEWKAWAAKQATRS